MTETEILSSRLVLAAQVYRAGKDVSFRPFSFETDDVVIISIYY